MVAASIDGWAVPSLRNEHGGGVARWTEDDIATFMKTGRSTHSASFGAMNDVVAHSLQHLNDADLASIASYLKSLPPNNSEPAFAGDPAVANPLFHGMPSSDGAQLYLNKCAGCHRSDGAGYDRPSLRWPETPSCRPRTPPQRSRSCWQEERCRPPIRRRHF